MWQTELSGQVGSIKIEWRSENGLSRSLSPAQLFRTDSEVTRIACDLTSLQEKWVFVMNLGNFSFDFWFTGINSNDWLFSADAAMDKSIFRYYILLVITIFTQKCEFDVEIFDVVTHTHTSLKWPIWTIFRAASAEDLIWEKTFTWAVKNDLFRWKNDVFL